MLVKLLSGKSFFAHFILGILFLLLFLGKFHTGMFTIEHIWGVSSIGLTALFCYLFFLSSKLFKSAAFPFWFFIIWVLVFSEIATDTRVSVSLLVCTLLFWHMVHAEERADSKTYAFDVGILLSISTFFYPPSLFLIGLILFNYLYMQSLNLRIIILFILGFILPMAAGFQLVYLTDNSAWISELKNYFYIDFWKNLDVIWLIPVFIFCFIAWIDHVAHSGTQDVNKRHIYFLFFLYFMNWMLILIFFGGKNENLLVFFGFPISIFLGRYIQYQNSKVWKEIILWGFLATMAAFYFRSEIIEIYNELLGNVTF